MQVAEELDITPAQLALAWLLHQGEDIVPIPGTRKQSRVTENAAAAGSVLSSETLDRISSLAALGLAKGQTLV
jgi:aryl-alcohol dehydrogenase-like predicted oxidoreductase